MVSKVTIKKIPNGEVQSNDRDTNDRAGDPLRCDLVVQTANPSQESTTSMSFTKNAPKKG